VKPSEPKWYKYLKKRTESLTWAGIYIVSDPELNWNYNLSNSDQIKKKFFHAFFLLIDKQFGKFCVHTNILPLLRTKIILCFFLNTLLCCLYYKNFFFTFVQTFFETVPANRRTGSQTGTFFKFRTPNRTKANIIWICIPFSYICPGNINKKL